MAKARNNHPDDVLHGGTSPLPCISCCDHYAGTEKLIQKSLELQNQLGPVFDITCDLEDGAGVGSEEARRDMALTFICSPANKFEQVGLRVNDFRHSAWKADIHAAVTRAGKKISHIAIPKPTSAEEVRIMLSYLKDCKREAGIERDIPAHILIETHGALHEVRSIAALKGVRGLDFGLMDFVSEHCGSIPSAAMLSPGQFEHALVVRAKTEITAAAGAFGRIAAHNVTPQYKDIAQTRSDAKVARTRFGFMRMWSIHPSQIPAILEGMLPERDEIELSAEILLAAQKADWAPISHREKLHDRASYRYYWQILKSADRAGSKLDAEVRKAFFAD